MWENVKLHVTRYCSGCGRGFKPKGWAPHERAHRRRGEKVTFSLIPPDATGVILQVKPDREANVTREGRE